MLPFRNEIPNWQMFWIGQSKLSNKLRPRKKNHFDVQTIFDELLVGCAIIFKYQCVKLSLSPKCYMLAWIAKIYAD